MAGGTGEEGGETGFGAGASREGDEAGKRRHLVGVVVVLSFGCVEEKVGKCEGYDERRIKRVAGGQTHRQTPRRPPMKSCQ